MATMEDRLLGEKLHYYCSSSEDEGGKESEDEGEKLGEGEFDVEKSKEEQADKIADKWMGGSRKHNTGVKGVKEDARAYQRWILEKEQQKRDDLAKAAARFTLEDKSKSELSDLEDDGDEEFMAAYRRRRMQEVKEKVSPVFGVVKELTDQNFCETIDSAAPYTDVVVYIHEEHIAACKRYKAMLPRIAREFTRSLICTIKASSAQMSSNFIQRGLPTFITYKAGDVKATWINIREHIGDDADWDLLVESLQEERILPYN